MIIGIDPGFATIGYAFLSTTREPRVIDLGVISTKKHESFFARLNEIEMNLQDLIKRHRPDPGVEYQAGVEKIFFTKNTKTAIEVAHARGVIVNLLYKAKVKIHEYTPNEIKKATTGRGHAQKREVQDMIARILKLKEPVRQDDAADALAVAMCHWFWQEKTLLPTRNREY